MPKSKTDTKELKRGTYVSRAAFAKLQAEKKQLEKDIYILVMEKYSYTADRILVMAKYRSKFEEQEKFRKLLKAYAKQYIKDNPDSVAAKISREHIEFMEAKCKGLDNHPQL